MAKGAKKVVSSERLLALLFIGLLGFFFGAGTVRMIYFDIDPAVIEVPYLRNPAVVKSDSPVSAAEYAFGCYQARLLKQDLRKTLDPLLKSAGWSLTNDDATRVCAASGAGDRLLLITDDCTREGCTMAALLMYEPAAQSFRTLLKKETDALSGSAAIGDILSWTPETVTARVTDTVLEGPCEDSAIAGKPAYQDVRVTIGDGDLTVQKSCTYVACDKPVQCRNQQ
jgi:hypothetical protein